MSIDSSNKQIAKNTLFLYLRMFVSIIVNLYTVRLLWRILGVDNYGIYNVVGGIVLMFAFLNNAMVASSQRFISYALGLNDKDRLQKTFSMSLTVHGLLAILVLVIAETIGLWFLNNKLNIPIDRMGAANWVYQCSIISFLLTIISVPYNACIVAHEHMKVYGYLGIMDVFLKLGIVLLVAVLPFDVLIAYSILIPCLSIFNIIIYIVYCRHHFEECRYKYFNDHHLLKDMFSFAGWSFLGNMGISVRDQGINVILNMFFNVAVNAAKGIANQVGTVINGFASNFTMAVNPQLTKRYALGNIESMLYLLFNGCKFSLILMSFIVIPLAISAPTILRLWLDDVAPYTEGFLQLTLIMSLIDCVVNPITTSLQATGNIKKFQIVISIIMLLNLPLAWLLLKFYANPYIVVWVSICTSVIALVSRLILLHEQINFSYVNFFRKVYGNTLPLIIIIGVIAWYIFPLFRHDLLGIMGFFSLTWICYTSLCYAIAFNSREKVFFVNIIKSLFGCNRKTTIIDK